MTSTPDPAGIAAEATGVCDDWGEDIVSCSSACVVVTIVTVLATSFGALNVAVTVTGELVRKSDSCTEETEGSAVSFAIGETDAESREEFGIAKLFGA